MGFFRKKEGFVSAGNRLIQKGKTPAAQQMMLDGLDYYQNKVVRAFQSFPTADAALVITVCRTYANELEKRHPDSKGLCDWISENVNVPRFQSKEKVEAVRKR